MNTYRVLMVEDSPLVAEGIVMMLSHHKNSICFDVTEVSSIRDCLTHLECKSYHIILLDLNLSNGKGLFTFLRIYEAANKNVGTPLEDRTPIVVLTGDDSVDYSDVIRRGARDFISKPVSQTDLVQRLHTAILLFPYKRLEELHESIEGTILKARQDVEELEKKKPS